MLAVAGSTGSGKVSLSHPSEILDDHAESASATESIYFQMFGQSVLQQGAETLPYPKKCDHIFPVSSRVPCS